MAKLKETPITEKDIQEYLESQDDFQLELSVLNLCNAAGLRTWHGGSYRDHVTNKTRQFDVRAQIIQGRFALHMAIECKNLKSYYPLVVSRIPRQESEAYHDVIYTFEPNQTLFLGNAKTIQIKHPKSIYPRDHPVGKALAQIGRSLQSNDFISQDGEVYEKWSQALSQATDWVSSIGNFHETIAEEFAFSIVLPILVVSDGSLWVADYDSKGSLIGPPTRSDSVELFLGKDSWFSDSFFGYSFSHITLVTFKGFQELLQTAGDPHSILKFFPGDVIETAL